MRRIIGKINSYLFEDNLLVSLRKEWLPLCNGVLYFEVFIENNKIILESSKLNLDLIQFRQVQTSRNTSHSEFENMYRKEIQYVR